MTGGNVPVVNSNDSRLPAQLPIEVLATLRSIVRCGWVELGFNRTLAGYQLSAPRVSSKVEQTAPREILRLVLSRSCVTVPCDGNLRTVGGCEQACKSGGGKEGAMNLWILGVGSSRG
jgi:hypothetical protein